MSKIRLALGQVSVVVKPNHDSKQRCTDVKLPHLIRKVANELLSKWMMGRVFEVEKGGDGVVEVHRKVSEFYRKSASIYGQGRS